MASLNDRIFDFGLSVLDTEANAIYITSAEATTYTQATSTYALGNATSITVGAPQDRTGGGREVVVSAITGGSVTASGTATHYAIVDTVNSRLLATNTLNTSQAVVAGNSFSLAAITVGIPDPA